LSTTEVLESEHWTDHPLDEAMVLFDYIVQVFALTNLDSLTSVNIHQPRLSIISNCLLQIAQCSFLVSFFRKQEINSITVAVNRSVVVFSFSLNLDVRFIKPPARSRFPFPLVEFVQ